MTFKGSFLYRNIYTLCKGGSKRFKQDILFLWLKRFSQRKEVCLMPSGITVNHYVTLTRNVKKVNETIELCLVYSSVMI